MSSGYPGPPASKHVFLHQVHKLPAFTKVRFLGWSVLLGGFSLVQLIDISNSSILSYNVPRAVLRLRHERPTNEECEVDVDISNLLEGMKQPGRLSAGYWLHVIGYIDHPPQKRKRSTTSGNSLSQETMIQAVLFWEAPTIRVDRYEGALEKKQEIEKTSRELALRQTVNTG